MWVSYQLTVMSDDSNFNKLTHRPLPRNLAHQEGCSEIIITVHKQTREYFDEITSKHQCELVHIFPLSLALPAGYIAHFSTLIG